METTLKTAEFGLVAANYDEMFAKIIKLVPTEKEWIKPEINWAKMILKRQDRITWWLRYYRLGLLKALVEGRGNLKKEPELQANYETVKKMYEAEYRSMSNRTGITFPVANIGQIDRLRNELDHFLALPVAAIQNIVWDRQAPPDLVEEFKEHEEKWKAESEDEKRGLQIHQGDEIVVQFQDGWAWWKLGRGYCSEEAKAMGHCGNVNGKYNTDERILSLRKPVSGSKELWAPALTFILDGQGFIGEMKGRGNDKPSEKYHPYIVGLLERTDLVKGIKGGGYLPSHNFSLNDLDPETQDRLAQINPALQSAHRQFRLLQEQKKIGWQFPEFRDFVNRVEAAAQLEIHDGKWDDNLKGWIDNEWENPGEFIKDQLRHTQFGTTFEEMQGDSEMPSRGYELNDVMRGLIDRLDRASIDLIFDNLEAQPKVKEWLDKESAGTRYRNMYGVQSPRSRELLLGLLHASDPNIENYARWLQGKLWNVWRAGITDGVRQNMAAAMQEGLQNQTYARGPLGLYFEGKNKDTFWTAPVKTFYPLLTAIDKADGTGAFEPGEEEYQGDEYGDKWEVDWRYKDPVHEEYQKVLKGELKPIVDKMDAEEQEQLGQIEQNFFRGQTAQWMDWVESVLPGAWDQVADSTWNLPDAKARLQQEFQQLDLPFGRAQHASLLLQKNATFAMIAANYEEMFNAITSFNPTDQRVKDIMAMTNGAARAKEEIQWAKQRLKKQDRIVWWMRWFRLNLLSELDNNLGMAAKDGKLYKDVGGQKPEQVQEAAAVQQAYDYFHKAFEADVRAMRARTGDEGINHQYISRSLPHHNVVDHFLSLPVPEIQNTVWDKQTPKGLIKDTFEPAEKKWQDETKGLLKPHTEPDEDWEMEDPDKWRAAQSEVSQLTGHLKRLREGTAVRYIKRDAQGTIIAESSSMKEGYTEEPVAGEELQQAIAETEADLKDAQDRVTMLSQPEVDTVFIPFQDGWAWWRLSRAYCSEEAKAMGHCGNVVGQQKTDERILSLRQPVKRGKEDYWEPHLTFILEPNGKLGEMKGKANQKPAPQYHKYIIALLEDPRIKGVRGGGYAPDRNFAMADLPQETQDAIVAKNPNLMALSRRLQLLQQGSSSTQGNMFPATARQWQKLRTDIEEILWPDESDYSESLPEYDHTRNAWVTDTWKSVDAMVEQFGNDQAKWVSEQMGEGGGDHYYGEGVSFGDVISNNMNSKQEAVLRHFIQVEYPDEVEAWMEEQRENGDEEPDFNDADLADFIQEQSLDDVDSKIMSCFETGARYGAESEMYKALMSAVEEFTIQETGEEIILPKYTDKDGKQGITWDSKVFSILSLASGAALADKGEPWGYWKGSESEQAEITVEQPYYGWSGFDDDAFNDQIQEEFGSPESASEKAQREAKQQKHLETIAKKYPQAGVRRNQQGTIIGWTESPFSEENTKKWDAENKTKKKTKTKPKTKSRGASASKMASEFNHVKNELLEKLKALPYANEIKVFGGMATGHADRDPADIDLVIDLRGKTTHNAWTDLLALAKKYYGYLDPFIIADAGTMDGKPVFELWARNDYATGWIRSRNKKKMLKNMSEQGKPLSLIKPLELKKAAQNFTPQQMEREAEIWEDQFPANEPGGGPASKYVWHQDNQFPVAKLEGDAASWKPWFDQEKAWAAEGGRPEQYYEKQEEWWTKNPDEHMVIVQGTDGQYYVWEGTHRLAISKIHDMQTVPAFVGILKDNKTSAKKPKPGIQIDKALKGKAPDVAVVLHIEVPQEAREHFWNDPPEGNLEFWAFSDRPKAFVNEKIVFTFNKKPVAEARILKIEEPGASKCEQTGRYEKHHKVFWSPNDFKKLASSQTVTLADLYQGGELEDENEGIGRYVSQFGRMDFDSIVNSSYTVQTLPAEKVKQLQARDGQTVQEVFTDFAEPWQKKLVKQKMKKFDPNRVIVLNGGDVVDGNHHVVAAIQLNQPVKYIDLANPIEDKTGAVKTAAVPEDLNELQRHSTPEYDAVRYVVGYMQQNSIQQMPWKQFQQVFQQFAAKYNALFTQIRKNKPQVELADLQEWLQEQQYNQPEQAEFGIEYDRYHNPETSFRDAEQLVLRINQGANAQRILGEDSALAQYVGFVGQSSEMSGHPAGRNTIGWLRVDFVNQDWLLVDEVQSDLVNSVSQARLIVEANNFDEFMASLANDHMRGLVHEKGIGPGNFAAAKRNFTGQGYTLEKLEEIKQKLIELSRNWAEYAISSVLEIARRQGIKNVAIHTAETIGQRDPGVESNKIKIFYDNLAKQFGFKKQQLDMGELSGNFWVRTANATKRVMAAGKGYKIDAHQSGDTIWIDWFEVPQDNRGKGLGRQYYEAWEASLPKSIKLLRLFSADAGEGPAAGFWEKMGFQYVYDTEQGDESDQYMWKGINGNATPSPITDDRDEPEGYDIEDEPEKGKTGAVDNYLYHVTPQSNLSDIKIDGLRHDLEPNFYDTPPGVYFTSPAGLSFWKTEVEKYFERPVIVLRVAKENLLGLVPDEQGSEDCGAPTFRAPYAIPPEDIEIQEGQGWVKTSATKQLYYHGSDIKNLRTILTEGLVPEGKSKSWADDPNAGLTAPSRQTYGGIYLTRNLMTAIGAPRHGKSNPDFRMVMVTVEAQPNTLYLDEDSIVGILDSPFGNYNRDNSEMSVGESFMMTLPNAPESMKEILQNQQASYAENVVRYIQQRLEENKLTMAPDLEKRLRELLPGVFLASLARRTSHAYKSDERRIKEDGYDARNYDYQRAYHRIMGDRVEVPPKDTIIPTPQDGEATFRKAAEQLTRTLRSMLRIQQNGGWSFQNARTTQPIGYSGSNHITCVMEIRDGRGHYIEFNDPEGYEGRGRMTPIVVHYGTVPEDFNQQWKERVGGKIYWLKPGETPPASTYVKPESKPEVQEAKPAQEPVMAAKTADKTNEEGFWAGEGNAASGILAICPKTGRVALAVRSAEVDYPGTIATLGGAIKKGKSPSENAKIELQEETGYKGAITLTPAYVYTSEGGFKYHNFIGVVPEEFGLNPGDGSSAGLDHADELASMDWVPYEEVVEDLKTNASDYHPGFVKLLQNSKQTIERLLGIKKQASDKPTLTAFMQDLWSQTSGNPFNNRERVLGEDAIIEAYPFDGRIHLSFIRSVTPGKGQGSKGLDFLIGLANKHKVEIELGAKPVGKGGLKKPQLIAWYKRHGFKQRPGETPDSLIYTPPMEPLQLGGKMKTVPMKGQSAKEAAGEKEMPAKIAARVSAAKGMVGPVYHGTNQEFDKFELRPGTRIIGFGEFQVQAGGFFFTDDYAEAEKFGKNVMTCYLRMKKPLVQQEQQYNLSKKQMKDLSYICEPLMSEGYQDLQGNTAKMIELGAFAIDVDEDGAWFNEVVKENGIDWSVLDNQQAVARMKERGYDSTMVDEGDGKYSYFVISPDQIKATKVAASKVARPTDQKVQLLKQRYKFDDQMIETIIQTDPTEKDYVQWIGAQVAKKTIRLPEDSAKIKQQLETFNKLKNSPQFQKSKDIQTYTPQSLYQMLQQNAQQPEAYSKKEQERKTVEKGTEIVVKNGDYLVYKIPQESPDTTGADEHSSSEALCSLSGGTNWCTAQNNYAEQYLEDGPSYVMFYKGSAYAQLHPESDQFMDRTDDSLVDSITYTEGDRMSGEKRIKMEVITDPIAREFIWMLGTVAEDVRRWASDKTDPSTYNADSPQVRLEIDDRIKLAIAQGKRLGKQWENTFLSKPNNLYVKSELVNTYIARCIGQRVPQWEAAILNYFGDIAVERLVDLDLDYVEKVIKGRWPEFEKAYGELKNAYQPWQVAEKYCIPYRIRIPNVEEGLLHYAGARQTNTRANQKGAVEYAAALIPEQSFFHDRLEAELLEVLTPEAVDYAEKVKGRWPELETELLRGGDQRFQPADLQARPLYQQCLEYAARVVKGRWPEFEQKLIGVASEKPWTFPIAHPDPELVNNYVQRAVKTHWVELEQMLLKVLAEVKTVTPEWSMVFHYYLNGLEHLGLDWPEGAAAYKQVTGKLPR